VINVKEDLWKFIATALGSALVAGMLASYNVGRNQVTRDDLRNDMPAMIAQYSPYTVDAKAIAVQLQSLKDAMNENTSAHTAQYQHIEDQISQMQADLARVAAKSGVTAHPNN
jgi:hypothetical protein